MPLSLADLADGEESVIDSFWVTDLNSGRREMVTVFLERAKLNGESCLSCLIDVWIFGVLVVFVRVSAGVCDAMESQSVDL